MFSLASAVIQGRLLLPMTFRKIPYGEGFPGSVGMEVVIQNVASGGAAQIFGSEATRRKNILEPYGHPHWTQFMLIGEQ